MQLCKLSTNNYMLEMGEFCWTPSLDELVRIGNELNQLADDKLKKYFRVTNRAPYVYVRNGDVAIGIYVCPIVSEKTLCKAMTRIPLSVIERS